MSISCVRAGWTTALLLLAVLCGSAKAGAQSASASLAGEWKLDFSSVPNADDPKARAAPWLTFYATVVQVDSALGASMQAQNGPSGQFGCKRRGDNACEAGRMRLSWDEQDWQVFEFRLDPGSNTKGTGRAEIRFPTGATDRYLFVMVRVQGK